MMAICNQLNFICNYSQIDAAFEYYVISTTEKYIPFGAKCLDFEHGKIESLAFENGKVAYVMLKKGAVSRTALSNMLDDTLNIKKVYSADISPYILFRLFLYSLNNFESESLSFNNLTGKFYIFHPTWMKKNKSSFTAIGINIDSNMNVYTEAATFAKLSLFKGNKKLERYPKYVFSNKNNSLKRVFENKEDVYIKKGIYNKKAEIPFFTMAKDNISNNKVYYLYLVLDMVAKKYKEYLTFTYNEIAITESIGVERNKDFMSNVHGELQSIDMNYINLVTGREYKEEFDQLVDTLRSKPCQSSTVGDQIVPTKANVILIHNKDYYKDNEYPDPYTSFDRNALIQCITVEDSAEKIIDDNEAILSTILKEIVIKNDILHKKMISLDDWASYNHDGDWIFGKEKDGRHYYMIIHPNGSFDLYSKLDDLSQFDIPILNACSDYLTDNKGKEKTVIVSPKGDINIISRTNRYPLPSKDIFEQETLSRSKDARAKYLSGVVDINLYQENDHTYYSASIKGSGMNTKIVRAPHLYSVEVLSGQNVMREILLTLSTTFVKYKSFTVLPYPIKYLNEYISIIEISPET